MSEIIPAILPKSFAELDEKMNLVAGLAPLVHVDTEDGTLTRGSTWPNIGDGGEWQDIQSEVEGMPAWEELNFEAHLMIEDPLSVVEDWVTAGAERLIVHFEAFADPTELDLALRDLRNRFTISQFLDLEVGLAVNFDTDFEQVLPHIAEADFVHLMSIKEIGAQGHGFEKGIFGRIEEIKSEFPDTIIAVDGGVSVENAAELFEAGASRLVVGSAIYGAEDPVDALLELNDIARGFESYR